jgi:hypothetical protein
MHRSEHRLGRAPQCEQAEMHLAAPADDQLGQLVDVAMECADIAAGEKRLAFSAQDHGSDRRIFRDQLRGCAKLEHHLAIHRVEHFRPIEHDGGHARFYGEQNGLRHAVFLANTGSSTPSCAGCAETRRPTSWGKSSTMMQARRSA